jgi:hypothetical protein
MEQGVDATLPRRCRPETYFWIDPKEEMIAVWIAD